MQLETGEVAGLLGPNGAGKTTCFYMLVGLIPPDAGRIWLDQENISHEPIHRRARKGLSYLPQEASVFRRLSVADNIRAVLELQTDTAGNRLSKAEIAAQLERLLGELQITEIAGRLGQSLSGGERRRVEIARALANSPRFILLDEPFAGVDPIAVIEIQRIIRFLRDKGIGVLITDHNVRETLDICDHATIIHNGGVLAEGKPLEIVQNDRVREVYLGAHFTL
jgi:lipopolysaccharide export system ATP-binding protein